MPEFVVKGSKNDLNPGQSKKIDAGVSIAGDASTITSDYCLITQDSSMTLQYFNVPTTSYTTASNVWDSWLDQSNKDTSIVVDYNHLPSTATWRGVQCNYTNAMFSNVSWVTPNPTTTPNTFDTLWSAVPYDMVINGVMYNYTHVIYSSTYDGMLLMYKKHVDLWYTSLSGFTNSKYVLTTVNTSLNKLYYHLPSLKTGDDIITGYSTTPPTVYPMILDNNYTVSGITGVRCGDYGCNVFNVVNTALSNNASTTTQYNAITSMGSSISITISGIETVFNFKKYVWRVTSSGNYLYALYQYYETINHNTGGTRINFPNPATR